MVWINLSFLSDSNRSKLRKDSFKTVRFNHIIYNNHFSRRVNFDRDSADKITGRLSVRLGGRNQSAGRNSIKFPEFFDGVGHKITRILKYQVLTQFQEILYPVKTSLFTVEKCKNSKLSSQMFPEFRHSKNWHFKYDVCSSHKILSVY